MPQEDNVRGERRSWLAGLAMVAFVLPFVAACSDSTGPTTNIDPAATQAALDQVIDQYFVDNPGISSLETFQAAIGNALPSIAPLDLTFHSESETLFGLAGRMGANMRAAYARVSSLPMLMANIPVELLGTTFIFDPGANQYIPSDPPRAGAPADGVRFILYESTTEPLNEVGYLDLVDKSTFGSTSATVDVTLKVFITDASTTMPVLQYRVTGTATDTGGTLFFTGFLSDGSGQLDFDFEISGSDATGFSAGFELSAGDIAVTLNVIETQTGSQTLGASLSVGSDQIRFIVTIDATGEIQGGSGIFFDDGSGEVLVAIFSGNVEQGSPQLTNAEGDPLTREELQALANIFGAMEYAFVAMEELFAFGLALVGIAFFF